jgi:hypothetical protein
MTITVKPCARISRQRPEVRIRSEVVGSTRLPARITGEQGAVLRRFLVNKSRDLSLEMWVEARAASILL